MPADACFTRVACALHARSRWRAGIHSRKMNLLRGINLKSVAEKMPSASGAECKASKSGSAFTSC
jgi:ATP-dependent 26S proteasome regulatory subunit